MLFPPSLLTKVIAIPSPFVLRPKFIRARDCTPFSRDMHLEQPDDLLALSRIEVA